MDELVETIGQNILLSLVTVEITQLWMVLRGWFKEHVVNLGTPRPTLQFESLKFAHFKKILDSKHPCSFIDTTR